MKKRRSTTIPGTSGIWTFSLVLCSMVFMVLLTDDVWACDPDCGPCKQWDAGAEECESICTDSQCCDDGSCATPDTDWVNQSGLTVSISAPVALKNSVANAINAIPGVSGVTVGEVKGSVTGDTRECCDSSGTIENETCAEAILTLSVNLGRIKIWGPPAFVQAVDFRVFRANITIDAGVWVQGEFSTTGGLGVYVNPCGTGCNFASASISATAGITGGGEASACFQIWPMSGEYCLPDISLTVTASLSFTGAVKIGECGDCLASDVSLALGEITASCSVTMGSYGASFDVPIYPI